MISIHKVKKRRDGFTLIEVLVSMILISLSSMFLMKCMVTSLNSLKNSNIRFRVIREIEIRKNKLISEKFDSPQLEKGIRMESYHGIMIKISIKQLRSGLKKLTLTGMSERFRYESVFYLSKSLKGDGYG